MYREDKEYSKSVRNSKISTLITEKWCNFSVSYVKRMKKKLHKKKLEGNIVLATNLQLQLILLAGLIYGIAQK